MTDYRVGDRVRCTLGENVLVGTVQWVGEDGTCEVLVAPWTEIAAYPSDGWHIEKVSPPLPTKVGAIVRSNHDGRSFVLVNNLKPVDEPRWFTLGKGNLGWFTDEELLRNDSFEVIFEGVDA